MSYTPQLEPTHALGSGPIVGRYSKIEGIKLAIPLAIAAGAAAVVIKNPEVTRRFWGKVL